MTNHKSDVISDLQADEAKIGLAQELQERIAEEAFLLSERRDFESGFEDQDWIAAKRLVMQSSSRV
jgi:hypothetical protein